MKIVHHATRLSGGAGIAARRIHEGLLRQGLASSFRVRDAVPRGVIGAERVQATSSLVGRLSRRWEKWCIALDFERYRHSLSPRLEWFSDTRVAGPDLLLQGQADADVHHLHWTSEHLDLGKFASGLSPGTPLVWTMHDMNPMTGGCHYTLDCERFLGSCGACPLLGSTQSDDLSARVHDRKRRALASLERGTTCFVAASRWMAREAGRSSLLADARIEVIPYGLDTQNFAPRNRDLARDVFGIPSDRPVLLFAADNLSNHRKGLDLLLQALDDGVRKRVLLLAIGEPGSACVDASYDIVYLGRIENERLLSFAYSAADLFVSPARAENFGQVILEAMACAIPVLAYAVGGMPDMVEGGVTGLLIKPEEVGELRAAIIWALDHPVEAAAMGRSGRARVLANFRLEQQAVRYTALYGELMTKASDVRSAGLLKDGGFE